MNYECLELRTQVANDKLPSFRQSEERTPRNLTLLSKKVLKINVV